MNTSGLLQSYLLCKRPEVFMIPWTFQKLNLFLKWTYISGQSYLQYKEKQLK